ncbi:MAG: ABC transporter [Planctomycetota bacterium]|nr:MAG: ABC transporter [Planctomycetota bacterium]
MQKAKAVPDRKVVIRARGLLKRYGSFDAVASIDFEVRRGECFGFLGPNGAGKSTCMRMLYRSALVDSGELEIFGQDAAAGRADRAIKARLGVVPQDDHLDHELLVRENLMVYGRFYGLSGKALQRRVSELLCLVDLERKENARVLELSGGMKRRLLIARGLLGEPELLVLDEPTTGLDPAARESLWNVLEELRRKNMTLVVTTHYMDEAEKLCDRLVFMDEGRIIAEGEPRAMIEEQVAPFVVEFSGMNEEQMLSLEAQLGELSRGSRRYAGQLVVQTDREQELIALAHGLVPDATAMLRRSNLEDVFLELTGRGLGED